MKAENLDLVGHLVQHILDIEEENYEKTLDKYGHDSEQVQKHIYTLAWNVATELGITL
jgi:hypothetical protein